MNEKREELALIDLGEVSEETKGIERTPLEGGEPPNDLQPE